MQGSHNGPEKALESPRGHVIARIRPLKAASYQPAATSRGALGSTKDNQ
jgi:hypothetical protein